MTTSPVKNDLLNQFLATRSPALREELVLSYVSLVHYVMGKLGLSRENGSDYEDLVHQGLLGLIEAVDRFDPSYGTQFSTYATVRIRGKVLDYLRSLDWLSRTARHRSREVQQAITTLTEENQRPPSDEEIAEHLGLDVTKVQQSLVDSSRVIVSLDALMNIDQGNDTPLYETLADEDQSDPSDVVAEEDMKARMVMALKQLPEREQLVLSLYYYEDLTLKEIGMVLGVSESRVCQLHARAVTSLQVLMTRKIELPMKSPHTAGSSGEPGRYVPAPERSLPISRSRMSHV
ncbi:MAG: FliA/WhiG family RNA polymerase sigma factor [Chloroflexi bacterium]|nr:FliA/WhiG family RNA polymerase sigma factor [Chloroflexota bacterium]